MPRACKILVCGIGGLGCEIVKNLLLLCCARQNQDTYVLHLVDCDVIELSNLSRQFLFSLNDLGKPKALVAVHKLRRECLARNINLSVFGHVDRIESLSQAFIGSFHLVFGALDNVSSRRWLNSMLLSCVDPLNLQASIIPYVDGGLEGNKANFRVILPGLTPCLECHLDLFPRTTNELALCSLKGTPETLDDCISNIVMKFPELSVDEQILLISSLAADLNLSITRLSIADRMKEFTIIPNSIPVNSFLAGAMVLEAHSLLSQRKLFDDFRYPLVNFWFLNLERGCYFEGLSLQKNPQCVLCSCLTSSSPLGPLLKPQAE